MRADYLDASAIVKLVKHERETPALREYLRQSASQGLGALFSSRLGAVEVMRSVRRQSPSLVDRAREVLAGIHLVGVTEELLDHAGRIPPADLRALDAIHLVTAANESSVLRHAVVYDTRLAAAFRDQGLVVVAPGA